MSVYRLAAAYAHRLRTELLALGVIGEVQEYRNAAYLVVESDREDVARLIKARVPDAVLVPNLEDLA